MCDGDVPGDEDSGVIVHSGSMHKRLTCRKEQHNNDNDDDNATLRQLLESSNQKQ